MKEITAYVCEFCPRKKARMSKSKTVTHEAICFYNPARKACVTCAHFSNGEGYHDTCWGGEHQQTSYRTNECELDVIANATGPDNPAGDLQHDCAKWIPKSEVTNG